MDKIYRLLACLLLASLCYPNSVAHAAEGPSQSNSATPLWPMKPTRLPAPRTAAKPIVLPDYRPIVRVLDTNVPLTERESQFADIQKQADAGDTTSQYFVGSLYRIGEKLPGSPVKKDLDKARLYLSNAAIHGHLYAMAKMSEISLEIGEYQSAMDWAQIYAYYIKALNNTPVNKDYIAELVTRIGKKWDKNHTQEAVDDLNSFVSAHNTDVRAGLAVNAQIRILAREPFLGVSNRFMKPVSGFADYLVSLKQDGTVESIWLLDGTPTVSLGYSLKPIIAKIKVQPSDNADTRYAWIAFKFDDVECPECYNSYKRSR